MSNPTRPTRVTIVLTREGKLKGIYCSNPNTAVVTCREHVDQRGNVSGHSRAASFPVTDETYLPDTVRGWVTQHHSYARRFDSRPTVAVPKATDTCKAEVRVSGQVVAQFLGLCAKKGLHPRKRLTRMVAEFLNNQKREVNRGNGTGSEPQ